MSLRYLTAGESHGRALVGIIEGLPAGVPLETEYLHAHAKRRKLGYGRGNRQNIETDAIEILSGVRFGETLGSPIALLLANIDWRSWTGIMPVEAPEDEAQREKRRVDVPRPGHADRIGGVKYRHDDMRNVLERSSARETAMRVALGTCARRFLEALDITIGSRVSAIGGIVDDGDASAIADLNARSDASPVRAIDEAAATAMIAAIDRAKADGDSLGGTFEVIARNVPVGLGSYAQWDRRLEAGIGAAFLSLNAIKGVEVGMGFGAAAVPGSHVHDAFYPVNGEPSPLGRTAYHTNRSGGIDGGMSTGQPIVVRAAMKPIATLMKPLPSVDVRTGDAVKAHIERSDTCAVPAAAVIGEALLALVLAEAILEKFGGDSLAEIRERVDGWSAYARTR